MNFSRASVVACRAWSYRLALLLLVLGTALAGLPGGASEAQAADVQIPADVEAPFASGPASRFDTEAAWAGVLAQRAQEMGLHQLAVDLYRQALATPDVGGTTRRDWERGLVFALLAVGDHRAALNVLAAIPAEQQDDAWKLRRAIVAFMAGQRDEIAPRINDINRDRLPDDEVAWMRFLRAMAYLADGERGRAEDAFADAIALSPSRVATAWFHLAEMQMRLNADQVTEARLRQLQRSAEEYQGRPVGHEFALQYAAALERLGRRGDAVNVLTRLLRNLPANETPMRDKTLLLLGLVAGVDSREGFTAMLTLLEQGEDENWQRIALQRLAVAADAGSTLARSNLPRLLDTLLARTPPHPLREDFLYYRAVLALRGPNPNLEGVEEDATTLLAEFPASNLRPAALALLASSSWQRQRYRTAADYTSRLQAVTTDPRGRVRLAVLAAECHFSAGAQATLAEDYRNAADAYATAQAGLAELATEIGAEEAERAAGISAGSIFYHRVLALLNGGDLDQAAELLDSELSRQVDPQERWRAVWNYVRHLELRKRPGEAFERLEAWQAGENAPPGLRLRFLWLLAQLTLDTGRPGETATRVSALREFLAGADGANVPAGEKTQVESSAALIEAQALLDDNRVEAGMAALNALRTRHPESSAAIYSYIIQARHLSAQGQLVEAQKLLRELADRYPNSEYAPRALYEAAEQAKKRGAAAYLDEAKDLLEKLATDYPDSRFVYVARLEQGDILRRLNRFAEAEQIYLLLENSTPPSDALRNIAQLSYADTLMAQVDNNPAKFEAAVSLLERLTDLPPPADPDLRIEAGFKLGYGYQKRGDTRLAAEVYWDLYLRVFDPRDDQLAIMLDDVGNGRYWLARALLELGEIKQREGLREEAFRAYQAVLDHGLPGREVVQGRLDALRAGG